MTALLWLLIVVLLVLGIFGVAACLGGYDATEPPVNPDRCIHPLGWARFDGVWSGVGGHPIAKLTCTLCGQWKVAPVLNDLVVHLGHYPRHDRADVFKVAASHVLNGAATATPKHTTRTA